MHSYKQVWEAAKAKAETEGLKVVEHGWEQHVIIDEPRGLVYRYPRHAQAAAKLSDEVGILGYMHQLDWPVKIPELLDYDGNRASYRYIAGDVLDIEKLILLTDQQIQTIGGELGVFLARLHSVDPGLIQHKAWRQKGSLIDYYSGRITGANDDNPWKAKALASLEKLKKERAEINITDVVVHGDLHGLNTVVSEDGNHLQGVIDLSEIEFGDPHQDFRKIFMTDARLLPPALQAYSASGGQKLIQELIKTWAYVNEWSNVCHFTNHPENATYQRAVMHLERWNQI